MKWNLKRVIMIGLFMAINMLLTFIKIPIGPSMLHLGTLALFITALFLSPVDAALASGLGMGLFDLFSGYVAYMVPTIIIKGLMAFVVAWIARKGEPRCENVFFNLLAYVIGAVISLVGYFITNAIMFGSMAAALARVPGSLLTSIVGIVISLPIGIILVKRLSFFSESH